MRDVSTSFGVSMRRCLRIASCLLLMSPSLATSALAQTPARQGPIAVQASVSRIARAERLYRTLGEVVAVDKIDITTQHAGTIDRLAFRDGQTVALADPLVQMDSRTAVAELRNSEAQLTLARQTMARTQELAARSLRTLADQQRDSAALAAAEADYRARSVTLEILTVRAPFAGVVTDRRVSAGAFVTPGQPIATLQNLDRVLVRFRVPQRLTDAVRVGQRVRVESNINNSQAETTVARIDPVLDASTRLLTIEAEVSNARGALRPGSFIRVALVLSVSEHAVIVPVEAVVQTLTGTYVYAVRDGIAHRVTVQVGEKRDGFAEVLDGLSAGVQVVIEGQFKLEDGAAVQVASGPAPNPPR